MHFSNKCLPTAVSTADKGSSNKYISACLYIALKSNTLKLIFTVNFAIVAHLAKFILALWPPLRVIPLSPTNVLSPYGNCLKSVFNAHTFIT